MALGRSPRLLTAPYGSWSLVSQPGEPWELTLRYYPNYRYAYGSFVYRAFRVRSSLYDRDTTNNPDVCN